MTTQSPDATEQVDAHEIALASLYWASNPSLVEATNRLREDGYNNKAGHLSNHMAGRFLDAYMAVKATLAALPSNATTNASLVEALEPFAKLTILKRQQRQGNAAFYSLLHSDIERARDLLATLRASDPDEEGKL